MRISRLTDVLLSPSRRRLAGVALVAAIVMAATACTGARPHLAAKAETTTTTPTGGGDGGGGDATESEAAQAKASPIDVYPDATSGTPARQITAAEATSAPDVPVVFLVKRHSGERVEVYLPTAPAGSTGWVRTQDVTLSRVAYRIEIFLSGHRLQVFHDGTSVLDEPTAVGVTDRPEAGRTYYLKELLQPPNQGGPYGRYAYVLSGARTSVDSFVSGAGIIGIHGTSDRRSIGQDTTKGSIGVLPSVLTQLVDKIGLPLGTPVRVRP